MSHERRHRGPTSTCLQPDDLNVCGKCGPTRARGDWCGRGRCADGLGCMSEAGPACVQILGFGEACTFSSTTSECVGQLNCVRTGSASASYCVRPLHAGDPCSQTFDYCAFWGGVACSRTSTRTDANYVCKNYQVSGLGGPCDTQGPEPTSCDSNTSCSTNRCVALPGPGEDCANSFCSRGNYCDASGICRAELGMGAPCVRIGPFRIGLCAVGLTCSGPDETSTCVPYVRPACVP
jgi:hypothetical protein